MKGPQGWFCSTYSATRPPNRQTKLDFVLSHTAGRSKLRQRTWCWRKQGRDVATMVGRETKKLYKRDGNDREQELMKPETFLHDCKNLQVPGHNSSSTLPLHLMVVSPVELTRTCYSLTPWCRVFLEQLTGLQLVKKFPVFHGTRRFITAVTSFRHLSLSWASPIQSIHPHPTS